MTDTSRTYRTREEAETVRQNQATPYHWYVWQHCDGYWACSLNTRYQHLYYRAA